MARAEPLHVELVFCARPGETDIEAVSLAPDSAVADALAAGGLLARHGLAADTALLGIWGRRCDLATPLRDRDRIEIYRPLAVDPKEARRLRYKRHRKAP